MSSINAVGSSGINLSQLMNLVGGKHHHHHHKSSSSATQQTSSPDSATGATDLRSQIQTAVQGAIQNFDASSGSASDLMTAIQTAVNTTLQANGINVPGSNSQSQSVQSLQGKLATATGSQLDSLLQQNGITTQQFKDALLAAFQQGTQGSSSGGASPNVDLSSIFAQLFKSVPAGSAVDVQG